MIHRLIQLNINMGDLHSRDPPIVSDPTRVQFWPWDEPHFLILPCQGDLDPYIRSSSPVIVPCSRCYLQVLLLQFHYHMFNFIGNSLDLLSCLFGAMSSSRGLIHWKFLKGACLHLRHEKFSNHSVIVWLIVWVGGLAWEDLILSSSWFSKPNSHIKVPLASLGT